MSGMFFPADGGAGAVKEQGYHWDRNPYGSSNSR